MVCNALELLYRIMNCEFGNKLFDTYMPSQKIAKQSNYIFADCKEIFV